MIHAKILAYTEIKAGDQISILLSMLTYLEMRKKVYNHSFSPMFLGVQYV